MSGEKKDINQAMPATDKIEESGSVITKNGEYTLHCITVIGQIEGHYELSGGGKATKYEHILPLLVAVEESEAVDGLLVLINTVGGDVEAGLAIAELLSGMSKPTASLVLGGGHSIGVPIAVSCKRSFIVPSATMTLHPVRINGTVLGVPQAFENLSRMQERVTNFIVSHSRIERDILTKLLMNTDELSTDMGSVIDGARAAELGLIDEVGGLSEAIRFLKSEIKANRSTASEKAGENI
ncbi:MAG: ClpP family protease [Eubacteriales bacterium]